MEYLVIPLAAFAASMLPVPLRSFATASCTVEADASTEPPVESNTCA